MTKNGSNQLFIIVYRRGSYAKKWGGGRESIEPELARQHFTLPRFANIIPRVLTLLSCGQSIILFLLFYHKVAVNNMPFKNKQNKNLIIGSFGRKSKPVYGNSGRSYSSLWFLRVFQVRYMCNTLPGPKLSVSDYDPDYKEPHTHYITSS